MGRVSAFETMQGMSTTHLNGPSHLIYLRTANRRPVERKERSRTVSAKIGVEGA